MKNHYIPSHVACPMASCKHSNTCARYANYIKSIANEDTYEVLNVKRLLSEGENCPYRLVAQKQMWAKGFQRIYDSIPTGNAHYFYNRTPYTQRRFYKAKNGEILIGPDMQKRLLNIFERNGADMSIGFDGYEEQVVLVAG